MIPLKIVSVVIVAIAMDMALAHVLELPGKPRLPKEAYLAVQAIYYPGFTFAGATEPLGVVVTTLLALLMPAGSRGFWLTLGACVALVLMHAIYWLLIHPVNHFWIKDVGGSRQDLLCTGLREPGTVRAAGLDISARPLGIFSPRACRPCGGGVCLAGHRRHRLTA
jgi:hypothetical protein